MTEPEGFDVGHRVLFLMSEQEELKPITKGTVKVSGASEGDHASTFKGCYAMPPSDKGWAPSQKMVWTTDGGEVASRICPIDISKGNATGKLLAQMLGRQLLPKEEVDYAQFVGKRFIVRVEMTDSQTGTRVTKCTPM
jgi:hypothetical protein